jgi:hypothetical protein
MSNYNKLYTPADSAIVFIDQQPQMLFGVAIHERVCPMSTVAPLRNFHEGSIPFTRSIDTEALTKYVARM